MTIKKAIVYNENDEINKEIVKNHTYLDFVRNTLVCSLYTEPSLGHESQHTFAEAYAYRV